MKRVFMATAVCVMVFLHAPVHAEVGLRLNLLSDIGYSRSTVPQVIPVNWQSRFQPPGGSMTTDTDNHAVFWDIGAGVEPVWAAGGDWEIGVPVSYSITFLGEGEHCCFTGKKTVALTVVDWWDPVSLLEVKLEKTGPAAGISLGCRRWKVQWTAQKYRLFVQEFGGVDRPGGTNTASVISDQEIERGLGKRLDIGYRLSSGSTVGVYYERNGGQVWIVGLGMKVSISIL